MTDYKPFPYPPPHAAMMVSVQAPGYPPICLSLHSKGEELIRIEDDGTVYVRGEKIHNDPNLPKAVYACFPSLMRVGEPSK